MKTPTVNAIPINPEKKVKVLATFMSEQLITIITVNTMNMMA
jgi:hypothetical protein